MDPNNPGYPLHPQPPYPVTSQSPPGQPFPYYPNAMPSFPQQKTPAHLPHQQQQQPALGLPLQPGPGGAVMPAGFPQHSSGPHANFSAPPFAQPPVPTSMGQFLPQTTSAANLPPTAAQSYSQNMASVSANNMAAAQQQRPVPQQQQQQQQQQQTPSQPPSQAPQGAAASAASPTPAASAREKARVAALLDINSMLLQEVVNLQAAGKAGGPPTSQGGPDGQTNNPSPTSDQAADATKGPAQKPSPEYLECMRRLQANLAYLATVADRAKKSGGVAPPNPGIMTPPPHMPSMNDIYTKLSELFPHTAHGTPHQSPQPSQGNGKPSPSPATDSVV